MLESAQVEVVGEILRYIAVALAMGFGAVGAAVGEGHTAGLTLEGAARQPKEYGGLFRTMLIGQAVSESTGIYSLVVALLMLFVVS